MSVIVSDLEDTFKYEMEEKQKDVEAEKEKKKMLSKLFNDQKTMIGEYQSKINVLEASLKMKSLEINEFKKFGDTEQALLAQLEIYRDKVEQLENSQKFSMRVV
jgi:hypothetical protein